MRLVFIAGPYRGASAWEIEQNVRRAEALALEVWRLGAVAVCPHAMTRYYQDALPDDVWLRGMLELLGACHAVLLVPGWAESSGTRAEVARADTLGLHVFQGLAALGSWLRTEAAQ